MIDPRSIHNQAIEKLKEEQKSHAEHSNEWKRLNGIIRYHQQELRHIERMSEMGIKW